MRRTLTLMLTLALAAALLTGCTSRRNNDTTTGNTQNTTMTEVPNSTRHTESPVTTENNHNGSVSTDPDGNIGNTEHGTEHSNGTEHTTGTDHSSEPTETGEVARSRSARHR